MVDEYNYAEDVKIDPNARSDSSMVDEYFVIVYTLTAFYKFRFLYGR